MPLVNSAPPWLERFRGSRVLITGHTGFKGSWLSEWLLSLGAEVNGFALQPPTDPALFDQLDLEARMSSNLADVRDRAALAQVLNAVQPEFVFHMAAQPLVRRSYREPHETFTTNFLGTLNLLEELRLSGNRCVVVTVTSDKCYEATHSGAPLSESGLLGGRDCYSASKGAVELLVSSYRRSFFLNEGGLVKLATARAGNVIGGGDWSEDRIVPDCVRSLAAGGVVAVRNPSATRPWQHVLEPLAGYLLLASRLADGSLDADLNSGSPDAAAFNFGPADESERSVQEVVEEVLKVWPGSWNPMEHMHAPHESARLSLSSSKSRELLGWRPVWTFSEAIRHTVKWYAETCADPTRAHAMTRQQIADYQRSLGER
jgi:CDP-glucose 4,6-dehydratase